MRERERHINLINREFLWLYKHKHWSLIKIFQKRLVSGVWVHISWPLATTNTTHQHISTFNFDQCHFHNTPTYTNMYWIDGNHKSQTIRLLLTLGFNFALYAFNLNLSFSLHLVLCVLRVYCFWFISFSFDANNFESNTMHLDFFEAPNFLRCSRNHFWPI